MLTEIVHWSGMPVACAAAGAAALVTRVIPWQARRTLRAATALVELDLEADERLRLLPKGARSVHLLALILRSIAEAPEHWKSRLAQGLPAVAGSVDVFTAVERARLDRHIDRLQAAVGRYARRSRLVGTHVPGDIVHLLADRRSPPRTVDLTDLTAAMTPAEAAARVSGLSG